MKARRVLALAIAVWLLVGAIVLVAWMTRQPPTACDQENYRRAVLDEPPARCDG